LIKKGLATPHKGRRFLASWRNLTALLTVSRIFKKFSFTAADLVNLDESLITEQLISESWDVIKEQDSASKRLDGKKKTTFVMNCCSAMAKKFQLTAVEVIGKRNLPQPHDEIENKTIKHRTISSEFLDKIDSLLPKQPWKPGIHLQIAKEIGCNATKVSNAINTLIASGRRNRQVDGIVYDVNDDIIAIDLERQELFRT